MWSKKSLFWSCALLALFTVEMAGCDPCAGVGNEKCDPYELDEDYHPPPCPGASFNPYALSPCFDFGYPDYGWDYGHPDYGWDDGHVDAGEDLGTDHGLPDMPEDMDEDMPEDMSEDMGFSFVEPSFDWLYAVGGPGGREEVSVVASDAQGNVYMGGSFEGSIQIGNNLLTSRGASDIFIAHYSSTGSLRWVTQLGAEGEDRIEDGVCDQVGNLIATGQFEQTVAFGNDILTSRGESDAVIFQVSSASQVAWARGLGGKDAERGERVAIDSQEVIALGMSSNGDPEFESPSWPEAIKFDGAGGEDAYLLRITPQGDPVWVRRLAGPQDDRVTALTINADDEILFGGDFQGTASLDADQLTYTLESDGGQDAWMSQWNELGEPLWHRSWGGMGHDVVSDIVTISNQSFILGSFEQSALFHNVKTLTSAGEQDLYLMKLEQDGRLVWLRHVQSASALDARSLDASDRGIVFGTQLTAPLSIQSHDRWLEFSPHIDATSQPLLLRYDLDGEITSATKLDDMRDGRFEELSISGDQLFVDLVYRSENQRNAIMGVELPTFGQRDFALVKFVLP